MERAALNLQQIAVQHSLNIIHLRQFISNYLIS